MVLVPLFRVVSELNVAPSSVSAAPVLSRICTPTFVALPAAELPRGIYDSLCQQQWITENGSMITLSGIQYFHEMGIDVPSKHSRKICCACLDWSERRFHLGGYVGAALFSLYESKGWLTRHLGYREVTITEKGYAAFKTHFHI